MVLRYDSKREEDITFCDECGKSELEARILYSDDYGKNQDLCVNCEYKLFKKTFKTLKSK